jgi:hypothetical protein
MSSKKLTLSIRDSVIRAAKKYAGENGTSVSKLVEDYFIDLIYANPKVYPSEIQELIGIARVDEPPQDYKLEKLKYLEEKYLEQ